MLRKQTNTKDSSAKAVPETKPEDLKEDYNIENARNREGNITEEPIPKKTLKEQLDEDAKEDGRERKRAVRAAEEDDERGQKEGKSL